MNTILVIDAGTTAFKASLFSERMEMLSLASCEFPVEHPDASRSELDAEAYWLSCAKAVREALVKADMPASQVTSVAVTCHTDTLFVLDPRGRPVAKGILWTDPRAQRQAEQIQEKVGLQRLFHMTGQTGASAVHFASRLRWFLENHPGDALRAGSFLQTQDYLIYRLTGEAALDHSISCCSLLGLLEKPAYWPEMLELVGVPAGKLSRIVAPGEVVGLLCADAADTLGLPRGVKVVAAAMDQTAAALALGNTRPGMVTEITGAALVITATSERPAFDPGMQIPCVVHAVQGKFLLMPWCPAGGAALKWYRDQFFQGAGPASAQPNDIYDVITAEAASVAPGCEGVVLLPHFAGSGCPELDANVKAVLAGLTTAHERRHVSRAFLESIAFLLKQNLDALLNMGVKVEQLVSSGGGSRSRLWCQIKADVTGLPVQVAEMPDATSVGAALLGARAQGWEVADGRLSCGSQNIIAPDLGNKELYRDAFARFVQLDRHMRPFFRTATPSSVG